MVTSCPPPPSHSINAVGVDIAPFSNMPDEEEILLLPGLPLVNRPGKNPETDFWTFEIETPFASVATMENHSPLVTIDYVHPGTYARNMWSLHYFLSIMWLSFVFCDRLVHSYRVEHGISWRELAPVPKYLYKYRVCRRFDSEKNLGHICKACHICD